jgi:hypothetical protein
MIRKKRIHILSLTLLGSFLLFGFQNCSPLKFSPVAGAESMKLGTSADQDYIIAPMEPQNIANGTDGIADTSYTQEAYSGACEVFRALSLPLMDVASQSDFLMNSNSSDLDVPASGKVDIGNQAGHVLISAADTVALKNIAGGIQVNANSILSVENGAGDICLRSLKIGSISNVAGGSKILASVVGEISNIGETIHIYGAVVN